MATEDEINAAMVARGHWFVPVLISDLRQTADKGLGVIVYPCRFFLLLPTPAGKPSVVVDAVFHSSLKERCGVETEFKMFLIRTCAIFRSFKGYLRMSDGIQSWRSNTLSSSSIARCRRPSRRQTFYQRGNWILGPSIFHLPSTASMKSRKPPRRHRKNRLIGAAPSRTEDTHWPSLSSYQDWCAPCYSGGSVDIMLIM